MEGANGPGMKRKSLISIKQSYIKGKSCMEFDQASKKNRNEVIEKFYYFFNIIEEKAVHSG